jgi:hypothetical protein
MATAPERAAEYHADEPEPVFRASIAEPLINKTAAHAKALLDGRVKIGSDAVTLGTAVHQMLLRDDRCVISPYDKYQSNEAKAWKAQQEAAGLVPIKQAMWDEAREIAQACNGQLLELGVEPMPFTNGTAEHAIRWETQGVKCKSLLDWLRDDYSFVDDLKATGDANPRKFARHLFNMGWDIKAAFYVRAVEAAYGVTPTFRWVAVETKPPYPISVHVLSERAMASAQVKVDTAIQLWNECMASGEWPAYPAHVHEVDIPGWASDEADMYADVDLEEVPF